MATERRARTNLYCGPLTEIPRRELPGIEKRGGYVAEAKCDGAWCAWHIDIGGPGQHRFESRTGLEFEGSECNGLQGLDMGTQRSTIIVGELETASEAATKLYRKLGYRRFHAFDVIRWGGQDMRDSTFGARTRLLRTQIWHKIPKESQKRVLLVEQAFSGFMKFYDQVLKKGGEGLVLKPIESAARPTRSDGKTPEWIRVKPWRTVDYVVAGPALTEKKELSAKLGLWRNGRVHVVLQCQLPGLELTGDGKLVQEGRVVELYGREMFPSGALRHAQFRRWRTDKRPEDCSGETTNLAEL